MRLVFRLYLLGFLFVTTTVVAHPGDDSADAVNFDCDAHPADMLTELSSPLARIAKLICFGNGQTIIADPSWSWRYSGSFFDAPRIPASAHDGVRGTLPPFYFSEISVNSISDSEKDAEVSRLMKEIVTFRPQQGILNLFEVFIKNNHAHVIRLWVATESDRNGWMLVCTPECRPEYVIVYARR